ncbi:MAG: hypothetical protein ACREN2_05715 [Candidatus Dormibacteria bacterium]
MSAPESAPLVTITLDTPVAGWRYDEDGEPCGGRTIGEVIVYKAAQALVADLRDEVRKTVLKQVDEQIFSQVTKQIAEVIANPVQRTNSWGEPTGNAVSVRQHIADEVERQLANKRDNYGKGTVMADLIKEEVNRALRVDLSKVIAEARDKVVGKVRDQAATLLAEAVKDGLR